MMPLNIVPPILNSASPWATSIDDLRALYECPYTGAVTTRTSLLKGFGHDENIHQYVFFDAATASSNGGGKDVSGAAGISSLNTLGYSPIPLDQYLEMIKTLASTSQHPGSRKPFIVSVTGSAAEVAECYKRIRDATSRDGLLPPFLHMEMNLSCPNIADKPPPAYDQAMLLEYLRVLGETKVEFPSQVLVGIKTPPYTYIGQFHALVSALTEAAGLFGGTGPVDFITATNTLGSSLILSADDNPALNSEAGTGIGGLAGASLHPLSVGNVATIRKLLDQHEALKGLEIIGVGGVADPHGYQRMRAVGASAVALATALGKEGIGIFAKIAGN